MGLFRQKNTALQTISVPRELLFEAKRAKINISAAATYGIKLILEKVKRGEYVAF